MLTQELARSLWDYRDGKLLSRRYGLRPIGCKTKAGYVVVEALGKQYLAHRVVWLWHTGEEPELLDHINGDKADNRIENLRLADTSQNNWNANAHRDSKTGVKGVCPIARGRFRAYVNCRGKMYQSYHSAQEAAEAWVVGKRAELHGAYCKH